MSTTPPTRRRPVGVVMPRDLPAASLHPFARRADRLGFDELWVVEDLGYAGGFTQMATVLALTENITVGAGILPAAVRNPAFLAMEIATLANLYPGRVRIGLGHGLPTWMRQVGAWPASALSLLEETFEHVRTLLRGGRVSVDGRYVKLRDVGLEQPPAVVPPLLAGVRGPKSLALVGRIADGVLLAEPVSPEYLAATFRGLGPDGAPPDFEIVTYNLAAVSDDPAEARRTVLSSVVQLRGDDWLSHIAPLPFAENLRVLAAQHPDDGAFAAALPEEWVDRLALVGTPAAVRARIDDLFTAGATSVAMFPLGADPMAALEGLARVL
ncbi:MAG: LLM class flavin-dependent oxidoreductase [Georgenia sp.]